MRCGWRLSIVGALLIVSLDCSGTPPASDTEPAATPADPPVGSPWFADRDATSGIDFRHTFGEQMRFWYPEIFTGGVLVFDCDGDGLLDVYFVQGGEIAAAGEDPPGNRLYRNLGGFRFQDVTESADVGDRGYGMGGTVADYDGDGDVDIYVTNLEANVLYRNDGDGRFTDVTAEAGVGETNWSTSSVFFDADVDGDLDLYVVNYLRWSVANEVKCSSGSGRRVYCNPNNYQTPLPDVLYRNDGGGRFTDISVEAGIHRARGNGLGVVVGDFGGDDRVDVYVANDGMANQLWINRGDLRFVDDGLSSGTALNAFGQAEAGMGVAASDVDDDGDLDLLLAHLREETHTFYLREDDFFDDITNTTGLGAMSYEFTGFGLAIIDFDHDGTLDIYVANGRVNYWDPVNDPADVYAEPNQLFRGVGLLKFEEVTPRGGTANPIVETSRAAAFGDLDNDGAVDVVVINRDARPTVLRNIVGSRGHWVQLAVRDREGRHALHARVRIDAGGRSRWRRVERGYSYCASNDPRVHCGLGSATAVDKVTVYWEDGTTSDFGRLEADRAHVLQRP